MLVDMIVSETSKRSISAKHHFANENADDHTNKIAAIARHHYQHEKIIDEGCKGCEEASDGIICPRKWWHDGKLECARVLGSVATGGLLNSRS